MTTPETGPAPGNEPQAEERPWYKKKRFVIPIAVLVVAGVFGVLTEDEEETSAQDAAATSEVQPTETTEEAEDAPEETVEEAPEPEEEAADQPEKQALTDRLLYFPLHMAEAQQDYDIDAQDVGRHIVDDVDNERGIFDRSNWSIVAQCDDFNEDGHAVVGVIKSDELRPMMDAGVDSVVNDNTLRGTLGCS